MSRIEALLNHVPESRESTPPAPWPDRTAPADAEGAPRPPTPARTRGAPQSPNACGRGGRPTSPDAPRGRRSGSVSGTGGLAEHLGAVPFDFQRFYNDPRWWADATTFEQRLGAHYFNNPQTVDAARTALGKLRDVLMTLTPREPGESPAAFARRVETTFFKDNPPAPARWARAPG